MPSVAVGFNWKRATPMAANVAIVVSLIVNFTIELAGISLPGGIHGGTLAMLLSMTLFFGISFASKPPVIEPEVEKLMNL